MIEILILLEIDQLVTRLITLCVTGRVHLSQYCTSFTEIATYKLQRSSDSPRRLPIGNLESSSQHYKLGFVCIGNFPANYLWKRKMWNKVQHPKLNINTYLYIYVCRTSFSENIHSKPQLHLIKNSRSFPSPVWDNVL